jgi:hypothetical protein
VRLAWRQGGLGKERGRWRYKRLRWLVECEERDVMASSVKMRHELLCALFAGADGQQRKKLLEEAQRTKNHWLDLALPALAKEAREAQAKEQKGMRDQWAAVFGDPKDPKVQAGIKALYKAATGGKA